MPRAHLDLSPCASRHVPAKKLRPHAVSTLGSLSVHKETCSGKKLLHSHAGSTVGSLCVCKKTCSCDNTAAFARREHTWILLRAQRDMFWQNDCCVLTPRAHLDLAPCAKRHVPSKTLLHSHAVRTLGSLSVSKATCSGEKLLRSHAASTRGSRPTRKETCSIEKTAAISRCPEIDDFCLRTPDPVSTVERAHVPYAIGNP